MNSMSSMALPFAKANATRTAPLRERLFNDFIDGSFFMWIVLSEINGISSIGRATIDRLYLNRQGAINFRRVLRSMNIHPPGFN
jgi:hypothetical protein